MVKIVSISLDPDTHKVGREKAKVAGMSFSAFVATLIRDARLEQVQTLRWTTRPRTGEVDNEQADEA